MSVAAAEHSACLVITSLVVAMLNAGPGTGEMGEKRMIVQALSRKAHVFALRMMVLLLAKPDVKTGQVQVNLATFLFFFIW